MKSISCYHCRHEWTFTPPMSRRDSCPKCSEDCKICLNCKFYDRQVQNECQEDSAERVHKKSESNYCEYFSPLSQHAAKEPKPDTTSAKAKLASLFQDAPSDIKSDLSPTDQLEDLFKKKK